MIKMVMVKLDVLWCYFVILWLLDLRIIAEMVFDERKVQTILRNNQITIVIANQYKVIQTMPKITYIDYNHNYNQPFWLKNNRYFQPK